jgi:ABC-2 type transport system permease protein
MWQIMKQELWAWKNQRWASLAILFGVPLVYTLLFGQLYSANVIKYIPLVILDQDQTMVSRSLIQAFANSERYDIVAHVMSTEELVDFMKENRAVAALIIPPQFSRDIKQSRVTTIALETNATNLMFANNIMSTYSEIVQSFSAAIGQKLLEGLNQPPTQALKTVAPVRINVRIVDNPTVSYSNFIMPGMSMNGLMIAMFLVSCTLLTSEYVSLVRKNIPTWTIIFGKLVPICLLSVCSFALSIGVLIAFFQVPMRGSLLHLLVIGGTFAFAINAFGLLISSITPNVLLVMQNAAVYIMSAFLCSGYSWPLFAMNDFGRAYASILPITYAAVPVRDIMLVAADASLLKHFLILMSFGAVCCLLAIGILFFRHAKIQAQLREGSL